MKTIVTASDAPATIGPYSHGVRVGNTVFVSGMIPLDPKTGNVVGGDISAQTERVLQSLGAVLRASGMDYGNVVKTTIYLIDLKNFQDVNLVYAKYFTSNFPARSTVQVTALPRGVQVEIDAIAMMDVTGP
jgi:2-iminobutanoate/2-iminopropanoate deaminase